MKDLLRIKLHQSNVHKACHLPLGHCSHNIPDTGRYTALLVNFSLKLDKDNKNEYTYEYKEGKSAPQQHGG